jgi:hypothetical protein
MNSNVNCKDCISYVDCNIYRDQNTQDSLWGHSHDILMDLVSKKIGILINQLYRLGAVFLFTLPLGILTLHRILFQYSAIDHLHFSRNVCQSHKLRIASLHFIFHSVVIPTQTITIKTQHSHKLRIRVS